MSKIVHFGEFLKPKGCGQTELPGRSVLIGQKLVENTKIQKFKCDILSNFQTMCALFELLNEKLIGLQFTSSKTGLKAE